MTKYSMRSRLLPRGASTGSTVARGPKRRTVRAIIAGIIRNDPLRLLAGWLISRRERPGGKHMSLPQTAYFDANLPGASQTVRIASIFDAKVFVCRWVIRDRDPALKALLRNVEKAKDFATTDSAIRQLTQALASRGLLVTTSP
jgi:hypothetical protein